LRSRGPNSFAAAGTAKRSARAMIRGAQCRGPELRRPGITAACTTESPRRFRRQLVLDLSEPASRSAAERRGEARFLPFPAWLPIQEAR
jgi:hypothetical protein